jgi:hypothetical protein
MRRLHRSLVVALIALIATAPAALACETYTFGNNDLGLDRGVAWAFEGTVASEEANPDTDVVVADRPLAVTIRVDRAIVGHAAVSELRIEQDPGCDGFWYRLGDHVVAAVPRYQPFLAQPTTSAALRPPFPHITNYSVAVWVIDGSRVATGTAPHSDLMIGGRTPRTLDQLIASLRGTPETSTEPVLPSPDGGSRAPYVLVISGACGALVVLLRLRRADSHR